MQFLIEHTWDSNPVNHDPIRIVFSPGQGGLKIEVFGPFFNDPAAPDGPPGQAFPGLWNYEGGLKRLRRCCTVQQKANTSLEHLKKIRISFHTF